MRLENHSLWQILNFFGIYYFFYILEYYTWFHRLTIDLTLCGHITHVLYNFIFIFDEKLFLNFICLQLNNKTMKFLYFIRILYKTKPANCPVIQTVLVVKLSQQICCFIPTIYSFTLCTFILSFLFWSEFDFYKRK